MLEKLLQKPRRARERYAFWGAVSTTGVIALVWLLAFVVQFQEGGPFAVEDNERQTASAFSQFFQEVKDDFFTEEAGEQATSTEENLPQATSTEPSTTTPTTSPRSVQIATSSLQNR